MSQIPTQTILKAQSKAEEDLKKFIHYDHFPSDDDWNSDDDKRKNLNRFSITSYSVNTPQDLNLHGKRITNIGEPIDETDGVNKQFMEKVIDLSLNPTKEQINTVSGNFASYNTTQLQLIEIYKANLEKEIASHVNKSDTKFKGIESDLKNKGNSINANKKDIKKCLDEIKSAKATVSSIDNNLSTLSSRVDSLGKVSLPEVETRLKQKVEETKKPIDEIKKQITDLKGQYDTLHNQLEYITNFKVSSPQPLEDKNALSENISYLKTELEKYKTKLDENEKKVKKHEDSLNDITRELSVSKAYIDEPKLEEKLRILRADVTLAYNNLEKTIKTDLSDIKEKTDKFDSKVRELVRENLSDDKVLTFLPSSGKWDAKERPISNVSDASVPSDAVNFRQFELLRNELETKSKAIEALEDKVIEANYLGSYSKNTYDALNLRIENLGMPVSPFDAANKQYVDNYFSYTNIHFALNPNYSSANARNELKLVETPFPRSYILTGYIFLSQTFEGTVHKLGSFIIPGINVHLTSINAWYLTNHTFDLETTKPDNMPNFSLRLTSSYFKSNRDLILDPKGQLFLYGPLDVASAALHFNQPLVL